MRLFAFTLALSAFLFSSHAAHGDTTPDTNLDQRIQRLVSDLGNPRYVVRERAKVELRKIGEPALNALKEAATSKDLEVSETARRLVEQLEEKRLTTNLLAPKMVRLKCAETSVVDAVADLSRQSGYNIDLQGDLAALKAKKITLDTGETTFWQAFDALCQKAGLIEVTANNNTNNRPVTDPARPIRINPGAGGIQIQPLPIRNRVPAIQKQQLERIQKELKERLKVIQKNGGANAKQIEEIQKRIEKSLEDAKKAVEKNEAVPAARPARKARQINGANLQVQARAAAQVPVRKAAQIKNRAQVQQAQVPAKAAAAPQQIQVQQIQIQNGGVVIGGRELGGRRATPTASQAITLKAGTPESVPTFYAGALRIQALAANKNDGVQVTLRFSVEPRITQFMVDGMPIIERAIDNLDQELEMTMDSETNNDNLNQNINRLGRINRVYYPNNNQMSNTREVTIQLKKGEKASNLLRELKGRLTAKVLTPTEPLVTMKNVMKAAGKKATGKDGEGLELVSINRADNGQVTIQVRVDNNNANLLNGAINGNIVINGNVIINGRNINSADNSGTLQLLDGKGRPYRLVNIPRRSTRIMNGQISREMTMVFAPEGNAEAPETLLITGQRMTAVQVPFQFENVSLR